MKKIPIYGTDKVYTIDDRINVSVSGFEYNGSLSDYPKGLYKNNIESSFMKLNDISIKDLDFYKTQIQNHQLYIYIENNIIIPLTKKYIKSGPAKIIWVKDNVGYETEKIIDKIFLDKLFRLYEFKIKTFLGEKEYAIQCIKDASTSCEIEVSTIHKNIFDDYGISYKNESDNIIEPIQYDLPDNFQKELSEIYKDKFPIGENQTLSGGVHYHIHLENIKSNFLYDIMNIGKLKTDHLNTMLWCKFVKYNGKYYFLNRENYRHKFETERDSSDSKNKFFTYKTEGYSTGSDLNSIEFRANNVLSRSKHMDTYYKLLAINSISKETSFFRLSESFKSMIQKGIVMIHPGITGDMTIKTIIDGGYIDPISQEDFLLFKKNFLKLQKMELRHYGYNTLELENFLIEIN